jgi:hypothetical protein
MSYIQLWENKETLKLIQLVEPFIANFSHEHFKYVAAEVEKCFPLANHKEKFRPDHAKRKVCIMLNFYLSQTIIEDGKLKCRINHLPRPRAYQKLGIAKSRFGKF